MPTPEEIAALIKETNHPAARKLRALMDAADECVTLLVWAGEMHPSANPAITSIETKLRAALRKAGEA